MSRAAWLNGACSPGTFPRGWCRSVRALPRGQDDAWHTPSAHRIACRASLGQAT